MSPTTRTMQPTIPAMVAYAGPATVPIVKITTDLHSPRQNAHAAISNFTDRTVYDTTRPSITALKKNAAPTVANNTKSTEKNHTDATTKTVTFVDCYTTFTNTNVSFNRHHKTHHGRKNGRKATLHHDWFTRT